MLYGVLVSISSMQRSAISGHPLPEGTDFGPAVCSYTDLPIPQPAALWLSPRNVTVVLCSLTTTHYFQ